MRARAVVLRNENEGRFHQLCDELEAEWQPQTTTEMALLEKMAVAQWKLVRAERREAIVCDVYPDEKQEAMLEPLAKFQERFDRDFFRALRELEKLQKIRRQTAPPPPQEAPPAFTEPRPSGSGTPPEPGYPSGSAAASLRRAGSRLHHLRRAAHARPTRFRNLPRQRRFRYLGRPTGLAGRRLNLTNSHALRYPHATPVSRLHDHRAPHARSRHRSQHRHLQFRKWRAAEAPALPRPARHRDGLGETAGRLSQRRLNAQLPRLEKPEHRLRAHGRDRLRRLRHPHRLRPARADPGRARLRLLLRYLRRPSRPRPHLRH